jgi:hypothetical protein
MVRVAAAPDTSQPTGLQFGGYDSGGAFTTGATIRVVTAQTSGTRRLLQASTNTTTMSLSADVVSVARSLTVSGSATVTGPVNITGNATFGT